MIMGGNIFKLGRLDRTEYVVLENQLRTYLHDAFGGHYRIPRYYANKPDFGDIDVILSGDAVDTSADALWAKLIEDLSLTQYRHAGPVFSTVYENFQVDYFFKPPRYFLTTYHFLCFNDLGNLLGKIFRRFNLKYGERGLSYVFRRKDGHYKRDIEVSLDTAHTFAFLELDYDAWLTGFESLEQMYRWVMTSPYFSVEPYRDLSANTRKRARLRPTIQRFLAFIQAQNITATYAYKEDRQAYLATIDAFFPEANLLEHIAREKARETRVEQVKAKFGGRLVMRLIPSLEGRTLGLFLQAFQQDFGELDDFEEAMVSMSPSEIETRIVAFWRRWRETQANP